MILHLSRERKKTILVSSHLLTEIEQIATKVLIIDKGKKIIEGDSSQLFDPAQTIVELTTNDNSAALQSIRQSIWNENLQPQREHSLMLKLDRKQIPQLHRDLVHMDIEVVSLQPRHSLEDYFLQVTTGNQHVGTFSN